MLRSPDSGIGGGGGGSLGWVRIMPVSVCVKEEVPYTQSNRISLSVWSKYIFICVYYISSKLTRHLFIPMHRKNISQS